MPLTHVCEWSKHGWKPVTAAEVQRRHSFGSISAKAGLFMCELCGQYVNWHEKGAYVEHFKHSSEEQSKDCPDRVQSSYSPHPLVANTYNLPLRLNILSNKEFVFEIGLFFVPGQDLKRNFTIHITTATPNSVSLCFLAERIMPKNITYLPLGSTVASEYHVKIFDGNTPIQYGWPATIPGIIDYGTFFDKTTRKKLPEDADVETNHPYYLLTNTQIQRLSSEISCILCSQMRIQWTTWYIYEIVATKFTEYSAKFFLEHHARLSDIPFELQPVWPPFISSPYIIYHYENAMTFFIRSNNPSSIEFSVYPNTYSLQYSCENGAVIPLTCNNRQQLVSAGRTKVLKYTYLWKNEPTNTAPLPKITVKDAQSIPLDPGVHDALPANHMLIISCEFDGFYTVRRNMQFHEKRKIKSNTTIEISNIFYGTEIEIFEGLDPIWIAFFEKPLSNASYEDQSFVSLLKRCSGHAIPIPHEIGACLSRLDGYPQTQLWYSSQIRKGVIPEKAYRLLQKHIIRIIKTPKEGRK